MSTVPSLIIRVILIFLNSWNYRTESWLAVDKVIAIIVRLTFWPTLYTCHCQPLEVSTSCDLSYIQPDTSTVYSYECSSYERSVHGLSYKHKHL